ncbi:EF-hand-like domain-containing protein [Cynara cardunculus var. scolymus]|uniref:EF-hand-like domain-containing protein n=1 Tax=Cynara cardunculus var. scolymus TaxID=59895 RepID=A0A103YJ43_CYNCS|nr:EF-hand-like domain-containing protein [Cynara cardunculus var. scolymus]
MAKKRVSRIGNYAAIADPNSFSCTTFNILAPIYKRLVHQDLACRESEIRAYWLSRNERILDLLLCEKSSIICLQEFWVGNDELVNMYDTRLSDAGYINFRLARTNNRGDGLLTAVHKDYFRVIDHREFLFNDFGDRVAQLLHVEVIAPFNQCRNNIACQEILIVNTHLLFPHDSSIDWNGSKRGHVFKFLRSQGFVSSYDTAHQYTDADAHKWVSHRNHRGNICGVDFIWLLNPNKYRKVLKTSWSDAVFGLFKADNDGDYITYSGFCEALRQLNFIGHPNGLSKEETKDLWVQADIDGNGQRIWKPMKYEQTEDAIKIQEDVVNGTQLTIGYNVKNAVLYPSEAEKGTWPDDYSLSDHARLTVAFSPVKMPRSRLVS